jgi:hypothetical protein
MRDAPNRLPWSSAARNERTRVQSNWLFIFEILV